MKMSKKILAAILTVTAVLSLTVNVYAAPHAVTPQTLAASDKVHKYYTGIPASQMAWADLPATVHIQLPAQLFRMAE